MAYDFDFTSSAVEDLNKLISHNPALAAVLITEHVPTVGREPRASRERKKGDISRVRAYAFTFRGVAYRVVCEADDDRRLVTFVAIGVHDVAYRQAQNH